MKRVTIGPKAQIPSDVFMAADTNLRSRPCAVGSYAMELEYRTTGIPAAELEGRRERLLEHLRSLELTGYVLFDEKYIQYFTSFGFLATERPVAFVSNASGELAVFVPEFEVERVREETDFERVESYPEYPGLEHPMHILARLLESLGLRRVAAG